MFRVKVFIISIIIIIILLLLLLLLLLLFLFIYLFIFVLFFLGIRKCANTTLTIQAGLSQPDISRSLSGYRPRRSDWDGVVKKKTALRAIT